MLPLWTSVTESLSLSTAYCNAALTILAVPSREIGFMPIPEVSGNLILSTPISFCRKSINFLTPSVPASHSIPAYTSSLFSLKIIISTSCGALTGDGVPSYHRTGLTQAKRSNFCLSATLSDLIPPPTGVVNGPLIETKPFLIALSVASGNHSPVLLNAFSPAKTSTQCICLFPSNALATAASTTLIITGLISTPIPSPSI